MIGRKDKPALEEQTSPKGFDDYDIRLGDVMRGERATMGKSLLDVQRELKIKAPYIAAIENADPSVFETPGFIAGYVRSYARYLNMDPEWAYGRFCDESHFAAPASGIATGTLGASKSARKSKDGGKNEIQGARADPFVNPRTPFLPAGEALLSRIEPGAIGSTLVLAGLIAAIGFGGWSVLQEVQKVQLTPVNQTPGLVADVDGLAPSPALGDADTEIASFEPPTPDAFDRLYRPEALEVPVIVARDGPIAALDPATNGALVDDAHEQLATLSQPVNTDPLPVTAEPTEPVVLAPDADEVTLVAVLPTWVRVRAADQSVIFEKILETGERFTLPKTEEPPKLRVGNAGALFFAVGSETYGPAGDGPVVVKNVVLSADALRETYALADLKENEELARIVAEARAASE